MLTMSITLESSCQVLQGLLPFSAQNPCRKHCLLTSLLVVCFPSSWKAASKCSQHNSSLPHVTCTFQNLPSIILQDIVLFYFDQLEFCRDTRTYKSWLLPHITIQHHDGIKHAYHYSIRPSTMLGLGQWVEQCNLTMLRVHVLSNRISG